MNPIRAVSCKEAVVTNEIRQTEDVAVEQPQGAASYVRRWSTGFALLRWLIGLFSPQYTRGFFPLILLSPVYGIVCVGRARVASNK